MRFFPRSSASSTSVLKLPAAVVLLLVFSLTAVAQSTAAYEELPRFSQVSERLYRGAQPRRGGVTQLVELGVNTIINLRGASERTRSDEAEAAAQGLRYFNLPLPTWGRPEDGPMSKIMEVISAPESGRVFIHCKDGVDRTGTVVALYRITAEGWSAEAATAEARGRGMRRHQVWMRDYIGDYYERRLRETATPDDAGELGNRLGAYARTGERVAFRAGKTAGRAFLRAPGAAGRFLDGVF